MEISRSVHMMLSDRIPVAVCGTLKCLALGMGSPRCGGPVRMVSTVAVLINLDPKGEVQPPR